MFNFNTQIYDKKTRTGSVQTDMVQKIAVGDKDVGYRVFDDSFIGGICAGETCDFGGKGFACQ